MQKTFFKSFYWLNLKSQMQAGIFEKKLKKNDKKTIEPLTTPRAITFHVDK